MGNLDVKIGQGKYEDTIGDFGRNDRGAYLRASV